MQMLASVYNNEYLFHIFHLKMKTTKNYFDYF